MSEITVKRRDTHTVVFTVTDEDGAAVDITGATVRVLARRRGSATTLTLASSITNAAAGEVSHTLTGTLEIGVYDVEVESTLGGVITTAPNDEDAPYFTMNVLEDLG
jgi:hypothetical protein